MTRFKWDSILKWWPLVVGGIAVIMWLDGRMETPATKTARATAIASDIVLKHTLSDHPVMVERVAGIASDLAEIKATLERIDGRLDTLVADKRDGLK